MPSQIIQGYFNDSSIPKEYRTQVYTDLHTGKVDEATLELQLKSTYGSKYSGDKQIGIATSMGNLALKGAGQTAPQTTVPAPKMMVGSSDAGQQLVNKQTADTVQNFNKSGYDLSGEQINKIGNASTDESKQINQGLSDAMSTTQGGIPSLVTGAAKSAADTVMSTGRLAYPAAYKVMSALGVPMQKPEDAEKVYNEQIKPALEAKNTGEAVGGTAEKLLEFLLPMGEAAKAGKWTTEVINGLKLPNAVKKFLSLTARGGIEAATSGAVTAAQEGELNGNVALNAGVAGALPFAGAAINSVKGLFSKAPEALQKEALRLGLHEKYANALDKLSPDQKKEGIKFLETGINKLKDHVNAPGVFDVAAKPVDDFINQAKGSVKTLGQQLGTAKDSLTKVDADAMPVLMKMKEVFAKNNVKVNPLTYELDFSKSELKNVGQAVQEIKGVWDELRNATFSNAGTLPKTAGQRLIPEKIGGATSALPVAKVNARDLEALTGQIDNITGLLKSSGYKSSPANNVLTSLKTAINEQVAKAHPEFGALNEKYASVIKDLNKVINATKVPAGNGEVVQNGAQLLRRSLGVADKKYSSAMKSLETLAGKLGIKAPADLKTKAFLADLAEKYTGTAQPQGLQSLAETAFDQTVGKTKVGGVIQSAKEAVDYVKATPKIEKKAKEIIDLLSPAIKAGKPARVNSKQAQAIVNALKAALYTGISKS